MLTELADYEYYVEVYGGISIPDTSFKKIMINASSKVNYYTFNHITELDDNIKNATCEIIELLFNQNQLIAKQDDDTSTVASETVGVHSKSYVNKSSLQSQRILKSDELEQECYKICLKYLSRTGLMYRGI